MKVAIPSTPVVMIIGNTCINYINIFSHGPSICILIQKRMSLNFFYQVLLGSLLALIHAHKMCLTVDKEAVAQYDAKLKEERKRAEDQVNEIAHRKVKIISINKVQSALVICGIVNIGPSNNKRYNKCMAQTY
jgi:hypothetical protein